MVHGLVPHSTRMYRLPERICLHMQQANYSGLHGRVLGGTIFYTYLKRKQQSLSRLAVCWIETIS